MKFGASCLTIMTSFLLSESLTSSIVTARKSDVTDDPRVHEWVFLTVETIGKHTNQNCKTKTSVSQNIWIAKKTLP